MYDIIKNLFTDLVGTESEFLIPIATIVVIILIIYVLFIKIWGVIME